MDLNWPSRYPKLKSFSQTGGEGEGGLCAQGGLENPRHYPSPFFSRHVALEVDPVMRRTNSTERPKPKGFQPQGQKAGCWLLERVGGKHRGERASEREAQPHGGSSRGTRSDVCTRETNPKQPGESVEKLSAVRTGSWELPSWAGLIELQRPGKIDWHWNHGGQVGTCTLKLTGLIACFENQPNNTLPRILTGTEGHNRTLKMSTIQSSITWYLKDQENASNFQDKRQTSTNSKMT